MFVYRDDLVSGIRLLRREEERSKNADNRHRLSDALGMLIDACNSRSAKEAEDCKNAARKG